MTGVLEAVHTIDARLERVFGPEHWDDYRASELDVCASLMCEIFDGEYGGMTRRKLTIDHWVFVPWHWMTVPADEDLPEHEEYVPDQWSCCLRLEPR